MGTPDLAKRGRKLKGGDLVKLVRVNPEYSNYVPALDALVGKYFQIQMVFDNGEVSIGSWHVPVEWLEPVGVWRLMAEHNALLTSLGQQKTMTNAVARP